MGRFDEAQLDLTHPSAWPALDALGFTSNGMLDAQGALVMGRGSALAFKQRWPSLPRLAGGLVKHEGHRVLYLMTYIYETTEEREPQVCHYDSLVIGQMRGMVDLFNFPTKHHWRDPADPDLIRRSACELMNLIEERAYRRVALPRPGCENGGLAWEQVSKLLEPILDERVTVVHYDPLAAKVLHRPVRSAAGR